MNVGAAGVPPLLIYSFAVPTPLGEIKASFGSKGYTHAIIKILFMVSPSTGTHIFSGEKR